MKSKILNIHVFRNVFVQNSKARESTQTLDYIADHMLM